MEAVGCAQLSANRLFVQLLVQLPQLQLLRLDQPDAELLPLLAKASKLEVLQLERVPGRTVTDAGFKAIATLTGLKALELGSLEGVSEHNFARLQHLTALQTLSLRHAPELRASSVHTIGPSRKLRTLDVSDCVNFGDDALLCVISHYPALESLSLANTAITDHALFLLSHSRTPQLKRLNLARCKRLTPELLRHVPNLTTLRDLRLEGTIVRKEEVLALKRRFPNKSQRITVSADPVSQ